MRKQKYKNYYVIGFAGELAKSGIVLDCFSSTGDGKSAFERIKNDISAVWASGNLYNGIELPKSFQAIRLVKVIV